MVNFLFFILALSFIIFIWLYNPETDEEKEERELEEFEKDMIKKYSLKK